MLAIKERTMANPPKIIQDEFSISAGNATFRLIWGDTIDSEDKADLLDWLKLVERRIARLPGVRPPSDGNRQAQGSSMDADRGGERSDGVAADEAHNGGER